MASTCIMSEIADSTSNLRLALSGPTFLIYYCKSPKRDLSRNYGLSEKNRVSVTYIICIHCPCLLYSSESSLNLCNLSAVIALISLHVGSLSSGSL